MKYAIAILIAVTLFAGGAEAKTCNKGKPCGNSCIALTKTCRK
ncbi:hypothetical protein [Magnetospirillum sulfuroxidans]|nr:hypothetical protein [Magnetospirillum sulfuroxidans]